MSKLCNQIHQIFNNRIINSFPIDFETLPRNGIYILFEDGENAHDSKRIVRVGTHTGEKQLKSRIKQHFITENKDRSIFRKNIGRAFLNKNQDTYLEKWNWDLTTKKSKEKYSQYIDLDKQKSIERKVTKYIQNHFTFATFNVTDKAERLFLEAKLISTISNCSECLPSYNWLGLKSPIKKIRDSGMWQVNELYKESFSKDTFKILESKI